MSNSLLSEQQYLAAGYDSDTKAFRTTSVGGDGSGSGGGGTTFYAKPAGAANSDAVVAYTSATTITVTGLPFTFVETDIVSIRQIIATGTTASNDTVFTDVSDFAVSSGVITVTGAAFGATDVFVVTFAAQVKAYQPANASNRQQEVNPLNDKDPISSLVDTTNVTAATHDYDFTMDGSKNVSISGKLIDADGTLTMKIYAMNDEDTTSGDRIQIYGYDDKNNITTNSWTVTNGTLTFAISFNNANYKHWRVEVVASGATNTVIVKKKVTAL